MRRIFLPSVTGFIIIALVSIASIGGSEAGDVCDFEFNEFYNGSSLETQDSEWECDRGGQLVFTIWFGEQVSSSFRIYFLI